MSVNAEKFFYNSNGGWSWEEGELEELEKSDVIDLDYTVGTVSFEGVEYSIDCDCWHKRALMIFDFLICYNNKIVELYSAYKKCKQEEVDDILIGSEE